MRSDKGVTHHPDADEIIMGKYQILRTEKNLLDVTFCSRDRKDRPLEK